MGVDYSASASLCCVVALYRTADLDFDGRVYQNDSAGHARLSAFEKQWGNEQSVGRLACLQLTKYLLADEGMGEGFKPFTFFRLGENDFAQGAAIELTVTRNDVVAEVLADHVKGGSTWLDDLAGDNVGINNGNTVGFESVGGGSFTTADATGEANNEHGGILLGQINEK